MNSKQIAAIFNTNQLGGAERSFISQLKMVQGENKITYYIPRLNSDGSSPIENEIKAGATIIPLDIPLSYYQLSRKNRFQLIWGAIGLVVSIPHFYKNYRKIFENDIIYANGNKVAFLLLLFAILHRYHKRFIWHFRDYPQGRIFRLIFKLAISRKIDLRLAANSYSVAKNIQEVLQIGKQKEVKVIYNPAQSYGTEKAAKSINKEKIIIGIPSMLAPWKGIHQIPILANLFEEQLKELNIGEIQIFGKNIYMTKGDHQSYEDQLRKLMKRFPSDLVKFKGLKKPDEIFSSVDIIIHTSIRPEPFGRVILEAFKNRIPVISTGLGGAAELVIHNKTGLIFKPFDYKGLYNCISKISADSSYWDKICDQAKEHSLVIEKDIGSNFQHLLE